MPGKGGCLLRSGAGLCPRHVAVSDRTVTQRRALIPDQGGPEPIHRESGGKLRGRPAARPPDHLPTTTAHRSPGV